MINEYAKKLDRYYGPLMTEEEFWEVIKKPTSSLMTTQNKPNHFRKTTVCSSQSLQRQAMAKRCRKRISGAWSCRNLLPTDRNRLETQNKKKIP